MEFQHHQNFCKSSKLIEGHSRRKRVSKTQIRPSQFKIPNPTQNSSHLVNFAQFPNFPTSIKNQLAGMNYLSYSNVNSIGNSSPSGPNTGNKRNSRFSKRLMEMQKALHLQEMKMRRLEENYSQQKCFVQVSQQPTQNYLSIMEDQKNSIDMMGSNIDRQLELDMDLDMCGEQSETTQIEYHSQHQIIHQIDYDEYESYLNV